MKKFNVADTGFSIGSHLKLQVRRDMSEIPVVAASQWTGTMQYAIASILSSQDGNLVVRNQISTLSSLLKELQHQPSH